MIDYLKLHILFYSQLNSTHGTAAFVQLQIY